MASRPLILTTAAVVLAAVAGYGLHLATAQNAVPQLSQVPMNITTTAPPAFIMAVDNSGSMTFQTQFPAADGQVCWHRNRNSFFDANGLPSDWGNCGYNYVMPATVIGGRHRIPPFDWYGFARSNAYNPAYFDPTIKYEPWINRDGVSYGNASTSQTRIDPRNAGTVALASEYWLTARMQDGMRVPAREEFRQGNNRFTFESNGVWARGQAEISIRYIPSAFFMPWTSANDPRPTLNGVNAYANVPRVRVDNACGTGCHMWKYTIRSSDTDALQNFANWFSYYGDRNRSMIAGMTRSMASITDMYVGYFDINSNGSYNSSTEANKRLPIYDMTNEDQKRSLYDRMIALNASGGTPNRQAVQAAGMQFMRTDANAPIKLSCQKNAVMLFTDGFSNGGSPSSSNSDGQMGAPFSDGHSGTMADIVSEYYLNNLRPDLPEGNVPVPQACKATGVVDPKLDCNPNLHINFYGVTLGARGNLFNPDLDQDPFEDASIHNNWPSMQNDNRTTVDDIWHATVNTRGEYINARTPLDITAAMERILSAVNEGATPAGTIAVTGSRIGDGSLNVQPRYVSTNNGTDWYGELTAETVTADPITGEASYSVAWEAGARIAAVDAASRVIKFGRTTDNVRPAVLDFTSGNVSLANLCASQPATCLTDAQALANGAMDNTRAVAYLRGSRVDEGILRTRTRLLGDIVNSSPVVSSPTDDYGYRTLGGSLGESYRTYLDAKRTANRPMVYVGANDGMFHMFDGRAQSPPGGNEVFAYIPATAVGHMGNLLFPYRIEDRDKQKFQHRYLVDGPIAVSDVNINGNWRTIVVGTSGAGGRSVFALDVTNPAAVTVLWEVNDLITGNNAISRNIGHVLGRPVIVPVKSSAGDVSWKVIFGNGYNSVNQQARLFVVDAGSGAVTTIEAEEASAPAYNGLGNVVVVDTQRYAANGALSPGRDGFADTVYAGDQNGAVWKFNLADNSVALSGQPLFVAEDPSGERQTITGGLTAASGPAGGIMLYFGTGSFSFIGDTDSTQVQTLYGILDRGAAISGRDALLQQTVGDSAGGFRGTSTNLMTSGLSGWYLDLPDSERFVGNPRIESGVVFFPTYEANATAGDGCTVNGANWLYGLNALNGAAALTYVRMGAPNGDQPSETTGAVSLNTGGSAPVKDVAVMTTPRLGPLSGDATDDEIDAALDSRCSMVVRVAGAPDMYLPRPCGRQSWRQVR